MSETLEQDVYLRVKKNVLRSMEHPIKTGLFTIAEKLNICQIMVYK